MQRRIEPAAIEIVADLFGHLQRELVLLVDRIGSLEEIEPRLGLLRNRLDQRQQRLAQPRKQRLQRRDRLARLEPEHQCIIGVLGIADRLGHLAIERYGLLEDRHELAEIALGPRLGPDRVTVGAELGAPPRQVGGDSEVIVEGGPHLLDHDALDGPCGLAGNLALGGVELMAQPVGNEEIARHHRQRRELLAARRVPAMRHHGARIPVQDRLRVEQVVDLPDRFHQSYVTH